MLLKALPSLGQLGPEGQMFQPRCPPEEGGTWHWRQSPAALLLPSHRTSSCHHLRSHLQHQISYQNHGASFNTGLLMVSHPCR